MNQKHAFLRGTYIEEERQRMRREAEAEDLLDEAEEKGERIGEALRFPFVVLRRAFEIIIVLSSLLALAVLLIITNLGKILGWALAILCAYLAVSLIYLIVQVIT